MQDSVTGLTIFCIYLAKVSLRLKFFWKKKKKEIESPFTNVI